MNTVADVAASFLLLNPAAHASAAPDADRPSYYERNRDQVRENQRLYRESNREKIRAIHKAYYLKNRAKITAYKRERWHQKKTGKGDALPAGSTSSAEQSPRKTSTPAAMRLDMLLNPVADL